MAGVLAATRTWVCTRARSVTCYSLVLIQNRSLRLNHGLMCGTAANTIAPAVLSRRKQTRYFLLAGDVLKYVIGALISQLEPGTHHIVIRGIGTAGRVFAGLGD